MSKKNNRNSEHLVGKKKMGGFIIQQRIQRGAIIQIQSTGSQQNIQRGR